VCETKIEAPPALRGWKKTKKKHKTLNTYISRMATGNSMKFTVWRTMGGGQLQGKTRLLLTRGHRAMHVWKLGFFSSCNYTHGGDAPAACLATRHTTVCLDSWKMYVHYTVCQFQITGPHNSGIPLFSRSQHWEPFAIYQLPWLAPSHREASGVTASDIGFRYYDSFCFFMWTAWPITSCMQNATYICHTLLPHLLFSTDYRFKVRLKLQL